MVLMNVEQASREDGLVLLPVLGFSRWKQAIEARNSSGGVACTADAELAMSHFRVIFWPH